MMRSPSFSRSSSSTTMTISPRPMAATASSILANGIYSPAFHASSRSTYLAVTSTSRLTSAPAPPQSTTVTQQPLTAIDAPSDTSSRTSDALMRNFEPLQAATEPSSSTMPVNIATPLPARP